MGGRCARQIRCRALFDHFHFGNETAMGGRVLPSGQRQKDSFGINQSEGEIQQRGFQSQFRVGPTDGNHRSPHASNKRQIGHRPLFSRCKGVVFDHRAIQQTTKEKFEIEGWLIRLVPHQIGTHGIIGHVRNDPGAGRQRKGPLHRKRQALANPVQIRQGKAIHKKLSRIRRHLEHHGGTQAFRTQDRAGFLSATGQ